LFAQEKIMKSQALQRTKIEVTRRGLSSVLLAAFCLIIVCVSTVSSSVAQSATSAMRSVAAPQSIISLAPSQRPSAEIIARHPTDSKFQNAPANYHVFPATSVGEFTGADVLTLNFAGPTRVTGIKSTTKDFVIEPGGSCLEGLSYISGASCSLIVRFSPQGPGHRLGFLEITHSVEATPANFGLTGNGYAPVVSFTPSLIGTLPATVSSGVGVINGATNLTVGGDILYVADIGDNLIREVDSTGVLNNLTPAFATPASLAVDSLGILYSANVSGSTYYFTFYTPWGTQTAFGYTYAPASCTPSAPCPFSSVGMSRPTNMSIDAYDDLFFEEGTQGAAEMPVASLSGGIGTLNLWYLSDQFAYATGTGGSFAVDAGGNLYTNYTYAGTNVCYLLQEPLYDAEYSPTANRVAGGVKCGFSGDGGQGRNAEISSSIGQIAFDIAGNLYFADAGNQRIRRIDAATGIIRTIAGTGTAGNGGDNGPATKATLRAPTGVGVDSQGQVYILSNSSTTGTAQVVRKVGVIGSLVFPSTTQGVSSTTLLVNVANTGNAALSFVRDTLTGTNHADFSIDNNTTNCNFAAGNSLSAGQNCQIGIIFKPSAVGARTATLNLVDNTVNGANKVNLSGTGVAAAKVSFTAPASAQLAAGTKVSVTVKVTSSYSTPTGKVSFTIDGKASGSATLNSGAASVTVASLASGSHQLVAAYGGDKEHAHAQATRTLTVK
jgi:Bacterial Ig-like domain (group 3)